MPWKESSVMDERLRFVARLLDGEGMTEVCRDFGISRKTGYKLFERYKEDGPVALCDRSRRPVRYANQLPQQLEAAIIRTKQEKPHWGARKIRELLVRRLAGETRIPAISTIHATLDRHGLVRRMGRRRRIAGLTRPWRSKTAWMVLLAGTRTSPARRRRSSSRSLRAPQWGLSSLHRTISVSIAAGSWLA